jgi:hypothetical protein
MVKLTEHLKAAGWDRDADSFRDALVDIFAEMFRAWTDEELLFNPREAIQFCNVARSRLRTKDLPDHVILRTLVNVRKRGNQKKAS